MGAFQNNKLFFLFILKFFGSYLLLSGLYWAYLSQYNTAVFETDGITHLVARQSSAFVNSMGEEARIEKLSSQAAYAFFVNGKRVARIVEGCNAVSVMVLFSAFIIAFSTTFKRTSLYVLMGLLLIYCLNIIRIGLLTIGLYYYKEQGDLLHDIIFPLFIYGVVFILWVAWIMKFSVKNKKNAV